MRLAITGGIAEGKSTVASYLRDLGLDVASADELAREEFESSDVQSELSTIFELPRPILPGAIRASVFNDEARRHALNRILHSRVLARMARETAPIIEIPLLFETVLQDQFERIWVVTCGPEEQFRRLVARTGNERLARNQLNTQLKTSIKCAFADRIVRTIDEPDTVRSYVSEAIRRDL